MRNNVVSVSVVEHCESSSSWWGYLRICGSSKSFCNCFVDSQTSCWEFSGVCVLYTLYSRSESAVGITLVLSRCWTLTGLLSVCSYCLFFVCSFSGQYFSSVCRRCGSLTLLSSNLHLHVWGFGSFWIFFWCVREGGGESCTNLLLWRELSVKVKLVIYRSIHIPSSALGSDRNNELTDTSARKQFFVCCLLETGWGGAQSRATPPPH